MSSVSVIVPTYNCARYIGEAIESVLRQTHQAADIIVVDDGSTDNTEDVLRPYRKARAVRYIRQKNQGPGSARNTGIKSATGEYVAFLDADDALTEESLEKRLGLLRAFPRMNFVFSDYFYEEREGSAAVAQLKDQHFLEKFAAIASQTPKGALLNSVDFDEGFEIPFFIHTDTVLVRKAALDEVGGFRTDIAGHEDTDLWLRLARNSLVGYVDAPLAYYKRFRGNLTIKNPLKYGEDRVRFLEPLRRRTPRFSKARAVVSQRLGWVHYDLGCHSLKEKKLLKAQRHFVRSLLSNPRSFLPYIALFFSFVPSRWRRGPHEG